MRISDWSSDVCSSDLFIQRLPSVSTVFRQRPMLLGNWVLMMSSRPSLSKSATSARGLADCHPSGPSPDAGPKLVAVDAVKVMLPLLRYSLNESETPATSRSCDRKSVVEGKGG